MKIIEFKAENIKRLICVEITPDGHVVEITGKNGQGKTSVLDAIWWALAGASYIQTHPIRKGADSARIELKLGKEKVELIVERRFTETQSYLRVTTPDGAAYRSPQKMLDDLLGALTFDPTAFLRMDSREQFNVLRGLVALGVDLDALKAEDERDYAARTIANRDARQKRAEAAAIQLPDKMPEQRIDLAALMDKITAAGTHNATVERHKTERARTAEKIKRDRETATSIEGRIESEVEARQHTGNAATAEIVAEIKRLTDKLKVIEDGTLAAVEKIRADRQAEINVLRAGADVMENELNKAPPLPEPIDVDDLRYKFEAAQVTNRWITERERRHEIEAEAEKFEKRSKSLTEAMEARDKQRQDALAKANMPIDGLTFGDGIVVYRELPLNQASDAEQLTVSMAIAAALNPKLRVLRIRDGSLLDSDAKKRVAAFAAERDLQVWMETVQSDDPCAIVMEDGHVRGQERAEAAE